MGFASFVGEEPLCFLVGPPTGWPPKRQWQEVCPPEIADQIAAWSADAAGNGLPTISAELVIDIGSQCRTVLVSVVALTSEASDERVLSLWADTTSQRTIERRLADTSRLESIGQLAAGVAHEINTPMQYIGDNGAFLDRAFQMVNGLNDDLVALATEHGINEAAIAALTSRAKADLLKARIPTAISQVTEGVEVVSTIVRSLKTFAHPGGEDFEPVDLAVVLDSTCTVSRNEWRYLADLRLDLADDLPPIRAIPGMLNQVFRNLVVNAAHAIEARLATDDSDETGLITVTSRVVGDSAETQITDNGTGIPEAIQGKVYDQFFTTKPVGKGSGQGLSICHNIVANHGGTIDFATSPAGTTFTVSLPVWHQPE